MMAQPGKILRKWLLGLALIARDRFEAFAERLEYGGQEKDAGTGHGTTPDAAKPARPDGPPDHWLRLVRRHAPELLQPGPSHAVTAGPPFAGKPDSEMPGSSRQAAQKPAAEGRRSARGAEANASLPSGFPAPGNTGSQTSGKALFDGQPVENDDRIAGGDMAHSKAPPDRDPAHAVETRRPVSINSGRHVASPSGLDITIPRPLANRQARDETRPDEKGGAGQPQGPEILSGFDHVLQSTNGHEDGPLAPAVVSSNHPIAEARDGPSQALYFRESERGEDIGSEIQMPASGNGRPARDHAASSPSGGSTPDAVFKDGPGHRASPAPDPAGGMDETPGRQKPAIGNQVRDLRQSGGPESIFIRQTATRLRWPRLPGEEKNDSAGDVRPEGAWPVLPDREADAVTSPFSRRQTPAADPQTQSPDRLQRLDKEQKGRPWNGSHF